MVTLRQLPELGAFGAFVYEPFPVTKVVATRVGIIANAFYAVGKPVIVLNVACQLM